MSPRARQTKKAKKKKDEALEQEVVSLDNPSAKETDANPTGETDLGDVTLDPAGYSDRLRPKEPPPEDKDENRDPPGYGHINLRTP